MTGRRADPDRAARSRGGAARCRQPGLQPCLRRDRGGPGDGSRDGARCGHRAVRTLAGRHVHCGAERVARTALWTAGAQGGVLLVPSRCADARVARPRAAPALRRVPTAGTLAVLRRLRRAGGGTAVAAGRGGRAGRRRRCGRGVCLRRCRGRTSATRTRVAQRPPNTAAAAQRSSPQCSAATGRPPGDGAAMKWADWRCLATAAKLGQRAGVSGLGCSLGRERAEAEPSPVAGGDANPVSPGRKLSTPPPALGWRATGPHYAAVRAGSRAPIRPTRQPTEPGTGEPSG